MLKFYFKWIKCYQSRKEYFTFNLIDHKECNDLISEWIIPCREIFVDQLTGTFSSIAEYMGMIYGQYDAKEASKGKRGFEPGGSSLHSCM